MRKKILIAVGVVLVIGFLIWNVLWLIHYNNYKKYVANIPDDGFGVYVIADENRNSLSVKFPNYLSFSGNLAVVDETGQSLIIWIDFWGNKKYGVEVVDDKKSYQMYLDENMELTGDVIPSYAKEKRDKYIDKIEKLYEVANNFWDLK